MGRLVRQRGIVAPTLPIVMRVGVLSRTVFVSLVAVALLFRLPAIINARGMNSDGMIVGLQARHILAGEWSWFLWGAGYQASLDALLAAPVFALLGANPWALMVVPLVGYILLLGFAYAILRRHLGVGITACATLVVILTPRALNSVTLYPPRQWCITCVFAAIWLLDGAHRSRRPMWRYAAGSCLAVLALYLDLFALQFLGGLGLFVLMGYWGARQHGWQVIRWIAASVAGALVGLCVLWVLRQSTGTTAHTTTTDIGRIPQNFTLLWETCLPWLLGYKVFTGRDVVWQPPALFAGFQVFGAAIFVVGVALGGLTVWMRRLPWDVRRLGVLGSTVALTALVGFLVSTMPYDQYAARYLAPIIWTAPFALAPVAYLLGKRGFVTFLAPYLLVAAVSGWLSFSPFVRGPLPVLSERGAAVAEMQVMEYLRQRDIDYAIADYWLAYRLTFLWQERPVVVPLNAYQDRYASYREGFAAAPVVAYLFHPSEPQAQPRKYIAWLREEHYRFKQVRIGDFDILIVAQHPE